MLARTNAQRASACAARTARRRLKATALAPLLVAAILAQAGPSAQAVAIPTANTGEASPVTTSTATLKGAVYPAGQPTNYYFEYGPTAAYGAQTASSPAGSGTQTLHVTANLTGLVPGSTYHYRLVAQNQNTRVEGLDRTFQARPLPLSFVFPTLHATHLFGRPFAVSGVVSGTGSANRSLVVQSNPFPYLAGFKTIGAAQTTNAEGAFSFPIAGLSENTQLRVATLDHPAAYGHVIVALVAVRVSLHVASTATPGTVRLYGTITPAEPGAWVAFQLLRPGRSPMAIGGIQARRAGAALSRFSRVVHIPRRGLYRATVDVLSGAQVSNRSRPLLIG